MTVSGWLQLFLGVLLSGAFVPLFHETPFNHPLIYLIIGFFLTFPLMFIWVWWRHGWKAAKSIRFMEF